MGHAAILTTNFTEVNCFHCGLPTKNPITEDDHHFCCQGCKSVFSIIQDNDLEKYYSLKEEAGVSETAPVLETRENYEYFDEESFKQEYLKEEDGFLSLTLYLEGVHCIACLWLIENLPQVFDDIVSVGLDFDNSLASFKLKKNAHLSNIANGLSRLGYKPHPFKNNDELKELKTKEEREFLIRLGVAMACMGNILLFSISVYAGLEGRLKSQFEWLSFFITLPVIFYCAQPFYKSALSSIRQKRINIDFPISLALIAGTFGGLYTLITGHGEVYFDSLTSLVFLLLLSRYILLKIKHNGVNSSSLEYFSSFGSVKILDNDGNESSILAKYLKLDDLILLKDSDMIPGDGIIQSGSGYVNTSLLTGESNPIKVSTGSQVFSGTQVISGDFKVKVNRLGDETQLGKILSEVGKTKGRLSPIANLSEKVSRYFVSLVLLVSFATAFFFYLSGDFAEGAMRALTLLIITCPCALALATPLALTSVIQRLSKKGVIIRSEEVIEKISKAKDIYLDKTGTLTKGVFQVVDWESEDDEDYQDIVWSLEKNAQHPISHALKTYIQNSKKINEVYIEDWKEVPGVGVSGFVKGEHYELKKYSSQSALSTTIALYRNGTAVLKVQLKDQLRSDTKDSINKLKNLRLKPHIVSGDSETNVESIAIELEIPKDQCHGRIAPEYKAKMVKDSPIAIMVGDGANDAMALKEADIGIAVKGSLDISLKAADIYLTQSGVSPINEVIEESRRAIKVIKRNMVFSLVYNIFGATLALQGIITPLIAAILMPISSLTVLLSTVAWSKQKEDN